jgi:ABC-type Mn2+/Zn2+ transport system ATPase subunit
MPLHCLNFDNVSFAYESSTEAILKNLSIQFTRGWCGVIGPNGSGKTTDCCKATSRVRVSYEKFNWLLACRVCRM